MDLACLRRYPVTEWVERGRQHTRSCALMGHCIESEYGLVQEDGRVILLDTEATPLIVNTLSRSNSDCGIRLRAIRRLEGSEMKTVSIEQL